MTLWLLLLLCMSAPLSLIADNCNTSCNISCNTCSSSSCNPGALTNHGSCEHCKCRASAQTYFSVIQRYQECTPEKISLFRDRQHARECGWQGAIEIVPFGGKSTKPHQMATYFTPFCKSTLIFDSNPAATDVDVIAEQIGIYPSAGQDFRSAVTFGVSQSIAGVGLTWRQDIWRHECGHGLWFDLSIPVYHVNNKVSLCEQILSGTGIIPLVAGGPENVTQAFNQAAWGFGKINACESLKHTGIADVDIKLGYGWRTDQTCHLNSYIGIIAPAGNRVHGVHVFEPIVGHNHATGFEFGSWAGIEIWRNECCDRWIDWNLAVHSVYFFRNTQVRSFDVKYKPWSRYMQVYASQAQAEQAFNATDPNQALLIGTPGINVFTQPLHVKQQFQRRYNTAFTFHGRCWDVEAGYNFFAREAECVELACGFPSDVAFKSLLGSGRTDSVQVINNDYNNNNVTAFANYENNIIQVSDLDLASAGHPAIMSHILYGTVGYSWRECEYPLFAAVGGSYEFFDDNTVFNRWTIWGKFGFSF